MDDEDQRVSQGAVPLKAGGSTRSALADDTEVQTARLDQLDNGGELGRVGSLLVKRAATSSCTTKEAPGSNTTLCHRFLQVHAIESCAALSTGGRQRGSPVMAGQDTRERRLKALEHPIRPKAPGMRYAVHMNRSTVSGVVALLRASLTWSEYPTLAMRWKPHMESSVSVKGESMES